MGGLFSYLSGLIDDINGLIKYGWSGWGEERQSKEESLKQQTQHTALCSGYHDDNGMKERGKAKHAFLSFPLMDCNGGGYFSSLNI